MMNGAQVVAIRGNGTGEETPRISTPTNKRETGIGVEALKEAIQAAEATKVSHLINKIWGTDRNHTTKGVL
jgi:hypothetical protein